MRRRLTGPASIPPRFGYVYALTLSLLVLMNTPFPRDSRRSCGIPVRVLRPGVIQAGTDRAAGLLVYVDRDGNRYLNSKRTTAGELPGALEQEFAGRADWSVYVDGDSDAACSSVVRAMDLVPRAQGRVILLTPKMRAEAEARRN